MSIKNLADNVLNAPPPREERGNLLTSPDTGKRVLIQLQLLPSERRAFKAEAASREMSPSDLFDELWQAYKASVPVR